ncbi:MAG: hypothetical protein AAFX06_13860 [Planctomycetota bacterium]
MRLIRPTRFVLATAGMALLLSASIGCRNTTSVPISPLGQASPLTPVSPLQPQLSPVQQTSGISPFGAPTRVPPPPTTIDNGSFSSNLPLNSGYAPTSNYGPSAVNSLGAAAPTGSGVRQTGWVGQADHNAPGASFNGGFGGNGLGNAAPLGTNATPSSVRAGGMQVIDLTQAPSPPGYVPPANFGAPNNYGAPNNFGGNAYPAGYIPPEQRQQFSTNAGPNPNNFQSNTGGVPLGQPINSSFPRDSANGFNSLPSTDLVPGDRTASSGQLNWQRPSPRF